MCLAEIKHDVMVGKIYIYDVIPESKKSPLLHLLNTNSFGTSYIHGCSARGFPVLLGIIVYRSFKL